MKENKSGWGCCSWECNKCKFYQKFLSISAMHDVCSDRGCKYEKEDVGTTE